AYQVGDRLCLLHEGRIYFTGTPEDMQTSEDLVVRQFARGEAEGPMTSGDAEPMSERRLHAQVGLLFVLSVTVLVLGILWFKEFQIRGRTYTQIIEFQTTSGVVKGDPVEVKGVPSGKVEDITLEEGLALVKVQLEKKVKLYRDAQ